MLLQTYGGNIYVSGLHTHNWAENGVRMRKAGEQYDPYGSLEGQSVCVCVCVCVLSHVRLFATTWTVARQAPLSVEFSRHKYWNWLPFLTPGHYANPGIEPVSLRSPALAGGFFTISATWRSQRVNGSPETQLLLSSNHVFPLGSLWWPEYLSLQRCTEWTDTK